MNGIIELIQSTIQSIAILLILGGMLVAFLHKLSYIINLVLGIIVTLLLTSIVYNFTGNILSAGFVFLIGAGASWVIAAIGGILCLLEGFALSALGFWGMQVASSPYSILSSGAIVVAIFGSFITTGIAAYLGDKMFSTQALSMGRKKTGTTSTRPSYRGPNAQTTTVPKPKPVEFKVLPEDKQTKLQQPEATMKFLDADLLLQRKTNAKNQYDKLQTEKTRGKINTTTAEKLETELQKELTQLDKDLAECQIMLKERITESKQQITDLNELKTKKTKAIEELTARYHIKQITRKDYKKEQKTNKESIKNIDKRLTEKTKTIQKFQRQINDINQSLNQNTPN